MIKICWGVIFALGVCLGLVGCSKPTHPDAHYFVLHPSALRQAVQQCELLGPNMARTNSTCVNAYKASQTLEALYNEIRVPNGQQAYGAKILHEQMQLAQLKQQYQQTDSAQKKATLEQTIKQVQFNIDARRAVLRYLFTLSRH